MKPRIMLITDDLSTRRRLERSLATSSLEHLVTVREWQDLDQVAGVEPDLLILDNQSYHGDMFGILRRLRQRFKMPILVLGHDSWQMVDILEAGADFYLFFPFSPRLLLARIEMLLRGTRVRQ